MAWQNLSPVNGRQLVADDLVFSYQRMRTSGWPGEARFSDRGIGEIEAVDDLTLKVRLEFRDADGLLALADGHSKIVAPEVVERFGDLRQAPVVGTGPWIFERRLSNGATEFNANPGYFEPDLPYLDAITVKPLKTPGDAGSVNPRRLALLHAGQIDVVVAPPTDWTQLDRSGVEFNSRVSQQPEIGMVLSLNTQAEPLDNLAIRQSIFRAVDPWEYVDLDWQGQGGVGMGMPVPSPQWQLGQSELLASYLGSHSVARDILEDHEIFYPPTLEIAVADLGPDYRRVASQIEADLESVGFEVNVTPVDPASMREAMFGSGPGLPDCPGPGAAPSDHQRVPVLYAAQRRPRQHRQPRRQGDGRPDRGPGCGTGPPAPAGPTAGSPAARPGTGLYVQPHNRLLPVGVRLGPGKLLPKHRPVRVSLLVGGLVQPVGQP